MQHGRVRRAGASAVGAGILLVLGAVAYLLAAWRLPPGFYDGFSGCPSAVIPYKWVSPPPQFAHGNLPPQSGTQTVRVENGQVQPATMFTADGQVVASWKLGAFDSAPGGALTVQILPASSGYPSPTGLHVSTNVYQVKANADLTSTIQVKLYYQQGIPAPTAVYQAPQGSQSWRELTSAPSLANDCSVQATTSTLGYFFLGYPQQGAPSGQPAVGGQLLPYVVAGAILVVILAGLPLAMLRRKPSD